MTPDGRADHLAAPTAMRPWPGIVHTLRALAARRRGVVLSGRPRLGRGVRLRVAPGARLVLGDDCVLGDGCRIHVCGGEVRVGARATLGDRCTLVAHAGIVVGVGAVLGDRVTIIDFDHGIEDVEEPIRLQPIAAAAVEVGDHARVGHGASLLRGATVPPHAAVGAHAVIGLDPAQPRV